MWTEWKKSSGARLLDALEAYRKAGRLVRECVAAELLGCLDPPESFDDLERAVVKNGQTSFEAAKHAATIADVDWILKQLGPARAAPELLEALQQVLAKMPFGANWDSQGNNPDWLKQARDAIAKAEGNDR